MTPPPDIRPHLGDPRHPAGPSLRSSLLEALRPGGARLGLPYTMLGNMQHYGDLVYSRVLGSDVFQINHPELIGDFFTRDAPHHHRNQVMQRARDILGNGLLTSEEPVHMRQRRLAQPAFLRERIASYGAVIGAKTLAMSAHWQDGAMLDLHPHMLELALRIVGKCLFDLDEMDEIGEMASAVDSFMLMLPLAYLPWSRQVERLPLPPLNRLRRGKRFLDRLIFRMIAERRADPTDRGDLLSMLLQATSAEDGQHITMTDTQLRDECVTIILAGHETTANALSFALHLLAQHPEQQQQLHAESAAVLAPGKIPNAAHYPRLPFATAVLAEAMRLYPPVWVTGRMCASPYRIGGYDIPAGATLLAPQFAVHRDPRWWPEPERFDPAGRWTPEAKASRPRHSYFPFGGGSRQCIAEGLAWMEGALVLAALARDWRLDPAPGTPDHPRLQASVSLRPRGGIPVIVHRRP